MVSCRGHVGAGVGMTEIVIGVAASHTTLMNTQWDKVDHLPRAHSFRDALIGAGAQLRAAQPDVVVIIGSNHFRGFWLDLMPAFTIGVGDVVSAGENGMPIGPLPCDPDLGLHVCKSLIDEGVDLAFSTKLTVDHGISHAFQWLIGDAGIPIVPIIINCFAPPLPRLDRVATVGAALGRALASAPGARRIAVVATGGLSHQLPFPDWRDPQGEDEQFLAQSWRDGRDHWQMFERRRRQIIVSAPPTLNPVFDRRVLDLLCSGRLGYLPSEVTDDALEIIAGNGGNEVRTWLMLAAAMNHQPGRVLAYSEMPEWLTGMAVAVIEPTTLTGDKTCQSGPI